MPNSALDLFTTAEPAAPEPQRPWTAPLLGEAVLGIDTSLTGFAICYSVPGRTLTEGEWKSDPAKGVRPRMARYEQLLRGTLHIALAHKPSLVLIEAYSFGSAHRGEQGHHDRLELGGILRWKLCELSQCPIVEVAPSSLKKFTTGDGKASKDAMVSAVTSIAGRRFKSNNKADAFALCELGLALTGQKEPPRWETPLGTPPSNGKRERAYLAALRKVFGLPEVTT